ncbi:MAG: YicC/YloC family endoribonuclease [Clostridiales bacterium]
MIQSMTGFGRGEVTAGGRQITVEIKSINHRYCEIQVKLPKKYNPLEDKLRQYLTGALSRGKIDLFIKMEDREGSSQEMRIDKGLALKYHNEIRDLAATLSIPMNLGVAELIALPGIMAIEDATEEMEEVWQILQAPLDGALNHLIEMRQAEGARIASDFFQRLSYLEELRSQLLAFAPAVVENYRQRLTTRISELLGQQPLDENRLIQEIAMFADRASVDEELVRLDSHFRQFRELLDSGQPVGRKLDFLCQEMNREINTVGSKANDLAMTKIVVEVKSELEKLREQVQNIE